MKVAHKRNQQHEEATIEDKYPNVAKVGDGIPLDVQENNYFKDHEKEIVVKKYLQFTVFMEALNEVLELDRYATVDTFARRIAQLVTKENSYRNGQKPTT